MLRLNLQFEEFVIYLNFDISWNLNIGPASYHGNICGDFQVDWQNMGGVIKQTITLDAKPNGKWKIVI